MALTCHEYKLKKCLAPQLQSNIVFTPARYRILKFDSPRSSSAIFPEKKKKGKRKELFISNNIEASEQS